MQGRMVIGKPNDTWSTSSHLNYMSVNNTAVTEEPLISYICYKMT